MYHVSQRALLPYFCYHSIAARKHHDQKRLTVERVYFALCFCRDESPLQPGGVGGVSRRNRALRDHIFSSNCGVTRTNWKWGEALRTQIPSHWHNSTSYAKSHGCSITSWNSTTNWGPNVQLLRHWRRLSLRSTLWDWHTESSTTEILAISERLSQCVCLTMSTLASSC